MTEQDLFIAALRLDDPAGRAALLERESGGDADLRRRVEVLLRAHADAAGFLEGPPTGAYQTAAPPADSGRRARASAAPPPKNPSKPPPAQVKA